MINLSLNEVFFGLISPFYPADSDKDNLNSYETTFPNFFYGPILPLAVTIYNVRANFESIT